jgi:hypothetical protein
MLQLLSPGHGKGQRAVKQDGDEILPIQAGSKRSNRTSRDVLSSSSSVVGTV